MSAICGAVDFTGRPLSFSEIAAMAEAAAHRGPDGVRHRSGNGSAFCHLALDATVESSLERQPLCTPGGSVCLVADVRLDNRGELLAALEPAGLLVSGRTIGDGELVLAAYLLWGEGCVERLLGDFAFAVWDSRLQKLLCARDALGVRPLCYARQGSSFRFATEAQQLLHHPGADRRLDEIALADYLGGRLQDPDRSFFQQVRRLPPGHFLVVSADGERLERFWAPDRIAPLPIDGEEAVERFREALSLAVVDRLRSQSPTAGLALSGGLDSPSVAALAQRHLHSSPDRRLLAYSFVFDRLPECDERTDIRAIASGMGLEVFFIPADERGLLDPPDLFARSLETPFQGWLACHLPGLRFLADHGARVLLTGQGADDLLRGSALVLAERLRGGDLRVVPEIWRYARGLGRSPGRDLIRFLVWPLLSGQGEDRLRRLARRPLPPAVPEWIAPELIRRTGLDRRLVEERRGYRPDMARAEISSLLELAAYQPAVHWQDRVAADFGMETRHPFLDRRLFELILSLPPDLVFQLGWYKSLLRKAMVDLLPDSVLLRSRKTSLARYVDRSLRELHAPSIEKLFRAPLLDELGLVDARKLQAAFAAYRYGGPTRERLKIRYPLTLEIWLRRHHRILGLGRSAEPQELFAELPAVCC